MTTARDIVKAAHRKINILGQGSTLTAEEANDGLEAMNDMIASWSTQKALIFTETKETFNLTGALSYTIGSGQDFDTTIPRSILSAYATYAGYDHPVQVIDANEFASISDKDLSGVPTQLYFDSNYPTATIYLYPINYGGTTLTLISLKPLTEFASLDTVYSMPPEYKRALIHNLAVEIAPEFEREASTTVKRIAKQSLDWVRQQNTKNNKGVVSVDTAMLPHGRYDIRSDVYR